jgi:flagellar secretion chaperone FliS
MSRHAHNTYLESRILSADPLELVRLMYQAAIAEVRDARLHLARHDIRSRSKAITKACDILTELTVSLDRKQGGEYAVRVGDLYGYMMQKLTQANFQQRDESMVEVLGLLTTLLDSWEDVQRQLQDTKVESPADAATGLARREADASSAPQSWSL